MMQAKPQAIPERVHAVLYGFGRVGQATLELAQTRPWLEVQGIIARDPSNHGVLASQVVPGVAPGLRVSTDAQGVLDDIRPDVVVVATNSTVVDVLPQLRLAAASGGKVICTAEELAYVEADDGPEALEIHQLAEAHQTPIVAMGVNPGFVLDLWPLVASGMAWDVRSIEARRIVDGSVFGPRIRSSLGIGFSLDEFAAGVERGSIVGHLGFRESARAIAASMGQQIDDIRIETQPIASEVSIERADFIIPAGSTAGTLQRAVATVRGLPWITIDFVVHAHPESAGLRTIDELRIDGRHAIHVVVEGGYKAVLGTAALLVNTIPRALMAPPGVYGPGTLPPPIPWLAARLPGPTVP